MVMDINDVDEILVTFRTGQQVIYKGKGLEKLRILMKSSPPLQIQPSVTVIDNFSDDEEAASAPTKTKKNHKKDRHAVSVPAHLSDAQQTPPTKATNEGGYVRRDLNYAPVPSNGRSAIDLAREMQRQAESSSGINFFDTK